MKNFLQTTVVVLVGIITGFCMNIQTFGAPTMQEQILRQINNVRIEKGLSELKYDAALSKKAATRAEESSFFYSHTRPDGTPWYTIDEKATGENLYKGEEYYAPTEYCVNMWTESASHLEVMMLGNVSYAGVGIYFDNGTYYICLEVA